MIACSHALPAFSNHLFTAFVADPKAFSPRLSTAFHKFVRVELNLPNNHPSSVFTGAVVV
ncbi:MAG: hypothetical protein WCG25_07015 [bacterium]